ncbi:chymotrypsin-like elastase family member 2A [Paramacrobiotus metropolitanus]|uniref:chymotrypsin-like elastase family member 2A n=1 Tax=Paramacrobiotus metropolitanus TaxID=2943436 RepID=UPI00244634DC|nr:chymotrypsin-like elastase family member 2A [Paramacrobiotus metropolitanus]
MTFHEQSLLILRVLNFVTCCFVLCSLQPALAQATDQEISRCGLTRTYQHLIEAEDASAHFSKLIGGSEAVAGSWPWQIRLGIRAPNRQIMWMCGGSILSDIYIITAAHCLEPGLNMPYVVRIGEHSANRVDDGAEDIPVLRARIHEKYNKLANYLNDIAILRLSRPIKFRENVLPVCLPSANDDPPAGTSCFVTGWGNTGPGKPPFSSVLKEGKVRVIGRGICQSPFFWGSGVRNTNICAGYPEGQTDACRGDSGGPLVCQHPNGKQWVLQGLVSFGWSQGCGFPGKPAVYTRVSHYLSWIEKTTGSTITS